MLSEPFELRAEGAVAAKEEVHAGVVVSAAGGEGLGERGQQFEALFLAHIAGVEEDDLVLDPRDKRGQLVANWVLPIGLGTEWMDRAGVDPVGEEDGASGGNAFGKGVFDHFGGDGGDAVEREGEVSLQRPREVMYRTLRGKQTEVEGDIDLEVLDMKPAGGAGGAGDAEGEGHTEQGRLHGEDDLRAVQHLAQHDGNAAQHEGAEVGDALEARRLRGDVERGAMDGGPPRGALGAVERAAIVVADAPGGIVGRCGNDADVVSALGQPRCHLTRVFANACELGSVVQAVDEDSQRCLSFGAATPPLMDMINRLT